MIIGICGVSSSGKTSLADKLAKVLNSGVIHLDDYFLEHSPVRYNNDRSNWEVPGAINFDAFISAVRKFKGKTIVVEGFLIFSSSELLELFDKRFYLDIDMETMISRRKMCSDKVHDDDYIRDILIPFSEKYRYSQLAKADIILDGRFSIEDNIALIIEHLNLGLEKEA